VIQGKLDLEAIVDTSPLKGAQAMIILLCALVAMVDGFDTQSIALAAPAIIATGAVKAPAFGLVFAAGLFGSLLGALGLGVVADRFGRKPALLTSMLGFGLITLATPFAHTAAALAGIRLATGLGLGGALPLIISLTSEFAPARLRSTLVSLMFCGFPLGAVIGGVAAARLIPAFGWPSLFYAGGAIPLLFLPLIAAAVPESARFLAQSQDRVRLRRVLDRMGWTPLWNGEVLVAPAPGRSSVASLFGEGRALGTLLLWATLFLSLLLTYFLINWIPIIARQSGVGMQSAVLAVSAVNLGAIIGCLAIGRLADRYGNATAYISCAFALGAVAIMLIGRAGSSGGWLLGASLCAGVFSLGAQMCTVAFCASFYETPLRATGVGWAIGVGRIGAIVGPLLGGALLATGTPVPMLFLLVGLMSVGSALGVAAIGLRVLKPHPAGSIGHAG
jgi:AAHS family 4-hydroxybenzoate transporter-like MFS transporter